MHLMSHETPKFTNTDLQISLEYSTKARVQHINLKQKILHGFLKPELLYEETNFYFDAQ